jgi:hypothetical protein
MAKKIFNGLDFQKLSSLQNTAVHPLAAAPSAPVVGQIYYDTSTLILYSWNGTAWSNKATDAALLNGQNAAFYLARANHTGTQLAATISDLATTVQAYRLDQFAAPTAAVSFGSQRITTLADPLNPQDAATKNYVDVSVQSAAAGIDSKPSVRLVSTVNLVLSGPQTIDSVSAIAGDRVLCTGQTTASQNGVYVVAAGAWTRALDADQTGEITPGAFWYVEEGTINGASQWRCSNTGTVTLGTTSITIVQFGGGAIYTASLGVQKVGNDFRAQVVAAGGIQAVAGGLQVDTAIVARKFAFTIGDGAATAIVVTHNLNTQDVAVALRLAATNEAIDTDWTATSVNSVTITFATAPAANAIKGVVIG